MAFIMMVITVSAEFYQQLVEYLSPALIFFMIVKTLTCIADLRNDS